ncbi:tRNA lysidine(34) synthetase TilS [Nostocoides sp. F2B08]|nr:tRNA lysidine(34) synthetase TilS [Tetrasphaera sp. F2B08]
MTQEGRTGRSGRPHPAVAAIRYAVRTHIADLAERVGRDDGLVLVACSGGADSLALAEAVAFECRHGAWSGGAVIVDHGLQPGSGEAASEAAETCRSLGLDPVEVVRVSVSRAGRGLEAAAREARHEALTETGRRLGAVAVLLGHTLDDQAEQVLLGLTRGSGTRSLGGMPARRGLMERPLLGITREQTREACAAEGLQVWDDPMNADPEFTRVRARRAVADLERELGPGVASALARSADQLRADADLLDALAGDARRGLGPGPDHDVATFAAIPAPLRTRVWRVLLLEAGAPAGRTGAAHTDACDRLLTHWRGQGPLHLPGDLRVARRGTRVRVERPGPVE